MSVGDEAGGEVEEPRGCRCAGPWTSGSPGPSPPTTHPPPSPPHPRRRRSEHRTTHTPEQAQARQAIKDCQPRLARYQAALEAGADPAVVTQWINPAQQDEEPAQKKLDALPTLTREEAIPTVDADKKGPLHEALGTTIRYEHAKRTATVRSRPSSPYRQWLCPRGELTTDDTAVVAQGRLRLQGLPKGPTPDRRGIITGPRPKCAGGRPEQPEPQWRATAERRSG